MAWLDSILHSSKAITPNRTTERNSIMFSLINHRTQAAAVIIAIIMAAVTFASAPGVIA